MAEEKQEPQMCKVSTNSLFVSRGMQLSKILDEKEYDSLTPNERVFVMQNQKLIDTIQVVCGVSFREIPDFSFFKLNVLVDHAEDFIFWCRYEGKKEQLLALSPMALRYTFVYQRKIEKFLKNNSLSGEDWLQLSLSKRLVISTHVEFINDLMTLGAKFVEITDLSEYMIQKMSQSRRSIMALMGLVDVPFSKIVTLNKDKRDFVLQHGVSIAKAIKENKMTWEQVVTQRSARVLARAQDSGHAKAWAEPNEGDLDARHSRRCVIS